MRANIPKLLKSLPHDRIGATAIEYGLIAALISIAIVAGLTLTGGDLGNQFELISNML